MKRSRTLLLLLGVVAFIHLGVLGWMIWSHHRVLAQGELIGIDLGLVYISEFSAEHSVFINPAVNIINRQPGEYFPDTDYSVPHRAWLTFETDEDGLSIPASWSLNRPDDTKGYLQISLRPSGRFSPAEMRITYPFGSYRLDHFTLSEELQQQIAEGHPKRYPRDRDRTKPWRIFEFIGEITLLNASILMCISSRQSMCPSFSNQLS